MLILRNVLGICQFAMFNDAIVQNPKKLNQSNLGTSLGQSVFSANVRSSSQDARRVKPYPMFGDEGVAGSGPYWTSDQFARAGHHRPLDGPSP